ncbi:MAG: type II toxin-antitoxin system ParD family antitoxin [Phormidium sp. BM_Day4_Bin.17]|nr:type II toxin-antitoxin system ParD family antitoxin [Phormidium sp. BM_Day4_Bin.17]UCJ11789.1 MAG: type II toxin-antitoxin system ParD family antitoxin [Phormidium sp. PBR-2020]
MNIILPRELEQIIQNQLENGQYSSAVDVVRAALVLLEEHEHRDRHEEIDGEAAIKGQQTTPEQPDSDRDYGVAWAKWFQDLENIEPTIDRATVKPSKSEIEEMIVEKYRQQGLEL